MTRIDAIRLQGVTHMYGPTAALRGVSLELVPGRIHFVQGANGAGKSTLLNILATVCRPTLGHVNFVPFGDDYARVRQHLGWVAHDSHCYRDLTARENVVLTATFYGIDETAAWERVADRVGAREFEAQVVGTLSRGQRQRVALARVLAHQPSLLLLDEPMSGLDQVSQGVTEQLLVEEAGRGTIVVVVTHQSELAQKLRGRLIQLDRGRVVRDEELGA